MSLFQLISKFVAYFNKLRLYSRPNSLEFFQLDNDLFYFPSLLYNGFSIAIMFSLSIIDDKFFSYVR